jgi:endogenous inhibitor of DNA gyrase (YacG/DUF329 family)
MIVAQTRQTCKCASCQQTVKMLINENPGLGGPLVLDCPNCGKRHQETQEVLLRQAAA